MCLGEILVKIFITLVFFGGIFGIISMDILNKRSSVFWYSVNSLCFASLKIAGVMLLSFIFFIIWKMPI